MKHVMDDRGNSYSLMVTRHSYFVYYGRIYPYSFRRCYNCSFGKNNQWKKYTLADHFGKRPYRQTFSIYWKGCKTVLFNGYMIISYLSSMSMYPLLCSHLFDHTISYNLRNRLLVQLAIKRQLSTTSLQRAKHIELKLIFVTPNSVFLLKINLKQ